VGGILAPFVRDLGHLVPAFDFAIPGVTSISADLHKSGFAAKPASTVTFCTERHRELARYSTDEWPSGLYSAVTFTGTRPGGAIAAAWAALNFLGREGYRRIAAASMRAKAQMTDGLARIPSVRVFGEPDLWAFAFGSDGGFTERGQVRGLGQVHVRRTGLQPRDHGAGVTSTVGADEERARPGAGENGRIGRHGSPLGVSRRPHAAACRSPGLLSRRGTGSESPPAPLGPGPSTLTAEP